MRSWFIYVLVGTLIFAGGCTTKKEVERKEWPETPAFQDEDTRKMLDSTEEVQDGYYLYTSKTGGYSMLWPVDAIKQSYQNNGNAFEKVIFSGSNAKENYIYDVYTTFDNSSPESYIDIFLSNLSSTLEYNGDYKEIRDDNKSIYLAKKKTPIKTSDEREYLVYSYFSYIRDNKTEQGFEYIYSIGCYEDANVRDCAIDENKEEERALMLMKTVNFNIVNSEDERE
ncbi:hypothetical protein [Metabacillus malikii]|uniref:Lipoprotein YvcA n=1 Tax=Metabacillus malikii TaxID=1504265 RepID=A0ABT9ZI50_9BACI|nr:hypothetical protein [Metabacillus malikii]MDQ0231213.1 hypothetical protein [Metabacillus malikii]